MYVGYRVWYIRASQHLATIVMALKRLDGDNIVQGMVMAALALAAFKKTLLEESWTGLLTLAAKEKEVEQTIAVRVDLVDKLVVGLKKCSELDTVVYGTSKVFDTFHGEMFDFAKFLNTLDVDQVALRGGIASDKWESDPCRLSLLGMVRKVRTFLRSAYCVCSLEHYMEAILVYVYTTVCL